MISFEIFSLEIIFRSLEEGFTFKLVFQIFLYALQDQIPCACSHAHSIEGQDSEWFHYERIIEED